MLQAIIIGIFFTIVMKFANRKLVKDFDKAAVDNEHFLKISKKIGFAKRFKQYSDSAALNLNEVNFENFKLVKDGFVAYVLNKNNKALKIVYIVLGVLFAIQAIRILFLMSK